MRFERELLEIVLVAAHFGERGIVAGRGEEIELVFFGIDSMDAGENLRELRRHLPSGARIFVVAEEPARDRLALDAFHHEKRRTERGRVLAEPANLGHGHAFGVRRAQNAELGAPRGVDLVRAGIAPEHEAALLGLATTGQLGVERPDFARRATRHAAEVFDRDSIVAAVRADKLLEAACYFRWFHAYPFHSV